MFITKSTVFYTELSFNWSFATSLNSSGPSSLTEWKDLLQVWDVVERLEAEQLPLHGEHA